MGELNSDDHYIYYCGKESLRKNGVAVIESMVIQIYAPTSNSEEAEVEWFYEDL